MGVYCWWEISSDESNRRDYSDWIVPHLNEYQNTIDAALEKVPAKYIAEFSSLPGPAIILFRKKDTSATGKGAKQSLKVAGVAGGPRNTQETFFSLPKQCRATGTQNVKAIVLVELETELSGRFVYSGNNAPVPYNSYAVWLVDCVTGTVIGRQEFVQPLQGSAFSPVSYNQANVERLLKSLQITSRSD